MARSSKSTATDAELSARAADEELVRLVAAGAEQAIRRVVDEHLGPLYRFAYRMLGDSAEAEDVAQETLVRLWQQAAHWEGRAKVRTWLLRVARNLSIDRLRARRTRAAAPPVDGADESEQALGLLVERHRAEAVTRALAELPERQRAAVSLVYYEGLRNDEAAEVLEVSVDALESLLGRARKQLGERLRAARRSGDA